MSKFIYLEIFVTLDNGREMKSEIEHTSVNIDHIVRFTSYGKFLWLTDGQRYTLSERGYSHLTEIVEKIEATKPKEN